jgi:hypothetical protein
MNKFALCLVIVTSIFILALNQRSWALVHPFPFDNKFVVLNEVHCRMVICHRIVWLHQYYEFENQSSKRTRAQLKIVRQGLGTIKVKKEMGRLSLANGFSTRSDSEVLTKIVNLNIPANGKRFVHIFCKVKAPTRGNLARFTVPMDLIVDGIRYQSAKRNSSFHLLVPKDCARIVSTSILATTVRTSKGNQIYDYMWPKGKVEALKIVWRTSKKPAR